MQFDFYALSFYLSRLYRGAQKIIEIFKFTQNKVCAVRVSKYRRKFSLKVYLNWFLMQSTQLKREKESDLMWTWRFECISCVFEMAVIKINIATKVEVLSTHHLIWVHDIELLKLRWILIWHTYGYRETESLMFSYVFGELVFLAPPHSLWNRM